MPYFENCGAKLYYEQTGRGRSLIFLHGATWDMRQWRRQVGHFARHYRVVTLDARGHGRSSLPPGAVHPDVFWRDVAALMNHLGIPKATLCGLSMGGHAAIQTAIHAQQRVEGLILIGTPCTNQFNLYERIAVPINRFCQRMMPMRWIAWSAAAALGGSNPAVKAYIRDVVGSMNHDAYNRVWKAVTSMESREGLPTITCPTLLLIGDRDWMTGGQQAYIHEHIQGSKLVTIQNAHHGTVFDNPEQVEQEMERFLSKMAAAPA